jgi:hypothetical protein
MSMLKLNNKTFREFVDSLIPDGVQYVEIGELCFNSNRNSS